MLLSLALIILVGLSLKGIFQKMHLPGLLGQVDQRVPVLRFQSVATLRQQRRPVSVRSSRSPNAVRHGALARLVAGVRLRDSNDDQNHTRPKCQKSQHSKADRVWIGVFGHP